MPNNDFNGDGRSDILWLRSEDVAVSNWLATPAGGFTNNDANALIVFNTMHHLDITATGDFNGDGRADVLWRIDGDYYWLGFTGLGGALTSSGPGDFITVSDNGWSVAGTGDFNGDGNDDLLWRHTNGTMSNWLGSGVGDFNINDANALTHVSNDWQIAGTGDFNGDGRADIMWQSSGGMVSNWLGTASGGFVINDANALEAFSDEILGIGDFNGDGYDDVLWRGFGDEIYTTITNGFGIIDGSFGFYWNSGFVRTVSLDWDVAAIGDYDGDGVDDILWRNDNGTISNWLSDGTGHSFTINDANALVHVANDWQVVDQPFL